ncbi:MAG: viperin family antiviral radical SAM protein [Turicibacter sp.]|nr:viperin family antiviral radical SAM protein [Turicibacter sp.]
MKNKIMSVSYHITEYCNMGCPYCFAKFNCTDKQLPKSDAFLLIERLAEAGCEKISFAGGEPTLCEWLLDLIKCAKSNGLTTMIITNGSGLTGNFLKEAKTFLDWIGLSVDTLDISTLKKLKRQLSDELVDSSYYVERVRLINELGYNLKINTVVTKLNADENLSEFINYASPKRWKLLRVLPLDNANLCNQQDLLISSETFSSFCKRHTDEIKSGIDVIVEDNETMINSYVIIDPIGRFVDNSNYMLNFSDSILKVGVKNALQGLTIDREKMKARKAFYW